MMSLKTVSPSVLKNEDFRRLCAAQFTSLTATYAIYFASMALVEEVTRSSAQMGLMIFSSTLPGLLFGLLAGVVVDRRERVGVLVTSNVLRGLVALGFLGAVHFLPPTSLLLAIYLCNFALSALVQFVAAAEGATLPRLVGEERLMAANSLFNLSSLGAQGAGLVVLAPVLIKLAGVEAVALISSILLAGAAGLVAWLPREEIAQGSREVRTLAKLWGDLREGWRFIAADRLVSLATLQLTLTSTVALVLSTLVPGFVARILGLRVEDVAYMIIPTGVGFGLGLALVGLRGRLLSKSGWINAGLMTLGLALASMTRLTGLGGLSWLPFLGISFALGLGFAWVTIPAKTLLQERPPAPMRGRVISTQLVLGNAANTLPLPLAGGLADLIGIRKVLLILACVTLGAAAASVHRTRG